MDLIGIISNNLNYTWPPRVSTDSPDTAAERRDTCAPAADPAERTSSEQGEPLAGAFLMKTGL